MKQRKKNEMLLTFHLKAHFEVLQVPSILAVRKKMTRVYNACYKNKGKPQKGERPAAELQVWRQPKLRHKPKLNI